MNTVQMKKICKQFPGVKAVQDVDFDLHSGEVHALLGENGAGKSTLMKILSGIYMLDSGEIEINNQKVIIHQPIDARRLGISIIEQEFSLFSELTVYQNIFIGNEYTKRKLKTINWRKIKSETKRILSELGFSIDVNKKVKMLSTSEQQIVEIAKAVSFGAKFIIMDEPTSSLGDDEKERLFSTIRELKKNNVGIIYISHRLEEIFEIADKVTVMRDGIKIGTKTIDDVDENTLIRMMVGREIDDIFYRDKTEDFGDTVLKVVDLSKSNTFSKINFEVKEGEVLGIYGLMGSQRTEIMQCIFGLDKPSTGDIHLFGDKIQTKTTGHAMKKSIVMLPEDRKRDGIIHHMSVKENIVLSSLSNLKNGLWLDLKAASEMASEYINALAIKAVSPNQEVVKLSGGNQQKVILGRCLALNPKLIILDEPTRGIDVGAKAEVHKIIDRIAGNRVAVIMISSEMSEILGASDRILVIHNGRITGEYSHKEATQEKLMASALE